MYTKRPVEPARWKTELKGGGWLAGFLLFSCLFAASCASISLEPQGPASKAVNGIFIIVLFLIHVLTAVYASQRPGSDWFSVITLISMLLYWPLMSLPQNCARCRGLCGDPLGVPVANQSDSALSSGGTGCQSLQLYWNLYS